MDGICFFSGDCSFLSRLGKLVVLVRFQAHLPDGVLIVVVVVVVAVVASEQ